MPVFEVVELEIVGFWRVEVNPPGPLHEYDVPPDEVKFIPTPAQTGPLFVAVTTGAGLTITVVVAVAEQLFASVTVTV